MKNFNSPLTWIGGKGKIRNWIVENFPPEYDLYMEPFCGATWVYFKIGPVPAVLNDINSDIVNFFKVMQVKAKRERLAEKLKYTPYSRELFAELCEKETPKDPVNRAWWFFCLTRMCFSGGGDIGRIKKRGIGISAINSKKGCWRATAGRFKTHSDGTAAGISKCCSKFIRPIRELDTAAELKYMKSLEYNFHKLQTELALIREKASIGKLNIIIDKVMPDMEPIKQRGIRNNISEAISIYLLDNKNKI